MTKEGDSCVVDAQEYKARKSVGQKCDGCAGKYNGETPELCLQLGDCNAMNNNPVMWVKAADYKPTHGGYPSV